MKIIPSKCACCLIFALSLTVTGAFGLLWIRQQVYLQASYGKHLEKELSLLGQKIQQTDLRISQIQSTRYLKQHCKHLQQPTYRQTIWTQSQVNPSNLSRLAAK
ncbi:MAG: hypothetical protein LBB19_00450 [Puniceicoccales bacterium]|jgi:hypothetical protein|nr:hypothetical protein [Puniceicoccales bacterium]